MNLSRSTLRTHLTGLTGLTLAIAAAAVAGPSLVDAGSTASADVRIRIGGGGHVRIGGGHFRHRPHYRYHGPSIRIGGAIWLGGGYYYQRGFAQPPPPPPAACDCATGYYPPVAPAPTAYAAAPVYATPQAPLPRFGIGVFLGGVAVEGVNEGEDAGLVGQFRLGRSLIVEGEVAKNTLADGDRVDRRLLVGLSYELRPHRRLTPYITGGLGVTQVDVGGGEYEDNQSIAELGGGLRWRMSDRISLFGDLRWGARQSTDDGDEIVPQDPRPMDPSLAKVMPENDEKYSRLRLGAMLTF